MKIQDICESLHQGLNTAGEKIKFEKNGFPIIQTRNINNGDINTTEKLKFLSKKDWLKYKDKYKPKIGDVFFTNIGTIGKTAIVKNEMEYLIHWNIFKLRPNLSLCTSKYLKLILDNLTFRNYFKKLQKGGTVNFVTKKMISDVNINLPPLAEQQRIVVKLDEVCAEIDKTITIAQTSIKEAEKLFQKYISKVFKGDDDWVDKSIDDITDKTKNVNPKKSPATQFKYVDVSSVSNKEFVITETQSLFGKDAPSRAKKNIITNDVIFATVRPTLKRIAIVPKERNGQIASTAYAVLRTNKSNHFKFLFYFLLSNIFMKAMNSLQRGASYPAVTDMDVKSQRLKVPNYKEQIKIVEKLDILMLSIDSIKNLQNKKIKELILLKQSILQQTLSEKLI